MPANNYTSNRDRQFSRHLKQTCIVIMMGKRTAYVSCGQDYEAYMNDEIINLRCSVQRALLGRIVPSMRAVIVDVTPAGRIIRVFFDRAPTAEESELLSEAETEVLADYTDNRISIESVTLPSPTPLPRDKGAWIFARFEGM
jgi:hypothetical protein